MKKQIILLAFSIILTLLFTACAHNIAGNFTGLVVSQGGIFFGSGTIAIQKEHASTHYKAVTDSSYIQFDFKTDTQITGYGVEFARTQR